MQNFGAVLSDLRKVAKMSMAEFEAALAHPEKLTALSAVDTAYVMKYIHDLADQLPPPGSS